jgi:eukaryotic-like serine/threonine-protein kinase
MSEEVHRQYPRHADARLFLSYDYWGRAQSLTKLERYAEALQDWNRALELDEGRNRAVWSVERAATLVRSGAHARAITEIRTLLNQSQTNPITLYNAACVYALCSAAIGQDAEVSSTEQSRLAEQYAGRAVQLLTKARAAGYFRAPGNVKAMRSDPDLEALHARPDFQNLVKELTTERVPVER